MDDTLQRLLDTELRAEKKAKHAEVELERIIQDAISSTQADMKRFEASIPALHASMMEKAEIRADQDVIEIRRRHDARHAQLRARAEQPGGEVMEAVFSFLINPDSDLAKARS